ncbi:MAG: orotidine-5'-phosphate decarboxylase [Acidaminococcaceae bacterium]|nr:orotidine-5'-phosphate decarboxylase [Acidaminococcaceae bacterium]
MERLIVALDFNNLADAQKCVLELGDSVVYYKVGMELYYACGSEIIRFLKDRGKKVFLDLKLQDIPNTVAHACSVLTELGADMLNVHGVGGAKMMKEAVKAVRTKAEALGISAPKVIAVTVLTSMDEGQFSRVKYRNSIPEQEVALAKLAQSCGLDGVVASPMEAAMIRRACGEDFLIVTPGVRPAGAALNDQSRVATPEGAIKNGATHIVVGRPITQAENPAASAKAILASLN